MQKSKHQKIQGLRFYSAVLLLAVLIGLAAFQAQAKSVLVASKTYVEGEQLTKAEFRYVKNQGRAWVELQFAGAAKPIGAPNTVLVPGLYYDSSLDGIVYRADGQKVLCTRWLGWGSLGWMSTTDNCIFRDEIRSEWVEGRLTQGYQPVLSVWIDIPTLP